MSFLLTSSICYDIMQLSNKGKSSKAVSTSDKKEVIFMRFELIALLSWLVREGYITSFHVTKDKIYVTIKK